MGSSPHSECHLDRARSGRPFSWRPSTQASGISCRTSHSYRPARMDDERAGPKSTRLQRPFGRVERPNWSLAHLGESHGYWRAVAARLVAVACLSGCAAVPLETAQNGSDWSFRLVADADEKISGTEKGIPCQLERVQHVEADMQCQPTTGLPHPILICRGSGKAS